MTMPKISSQGELIPTPGPNDALPVINDLKTKSFWLSAIIPGLLTIATIMNVDVLGFLGVGNEDELATKIVMVVVLISSVVGLAQRAAPNFRLKFMGALSGASPTTPTGAVSEGTTLRSHWLVTAAAGVMFAGLAACNPVTGEFDRVLAYNTGLCVAMSTISDQREEVKLWDKIQEAGFVCVTNALGQVSAIPAEEAVAEDETLLTPS